MKNRERISSRQNNRVKNLIKLQRKKYRQQQGRFLLEGFNLIETALKVEAQIEEFYLSQELEIKSDEVKNLIENLPAGVEPVILETDLFNQAVTTVNPQGVLAVARSREMSLSEIWKLSGPLLLLAEIQDPGNLGTIIRTAAAADLAGLITLKGSVDIFNPKVVRGSMGGIFSLPACQSVSPADIKESIAGNQLKFRRLVAAEPEASQSYYDFIFEQNDIIVIGNEARGLPQEIKDFIDREITIPLPGRMESLNAAVAASIVIFEMVKKLEQK